MQKNLTLLALLTLLTACGPKVGSDEWCADLKGKPKSEWSIHEAKDYAKHCIFK